MSLLLTAPDRLCLMLRDCDDDVVAAYHTHQDSLDYVERPCFLVTPGEASYAASEGAPEQAMVDENFTIDFIGEPFTGTEQDFADFYELQARRIAVKAVVYLLRSPNLQFVNQRGLETEPLASLNGVLWCRPESRSEVALMTRGGNDEAFWGFSINLSMRSLIEVDEDEFIVTGI